MKTLEEAAEFFLCGDGPGKSCGRHHENWKSYEAIRREAFESIVAQAVMGYAALGMQQGVVHPMHIGQMIFSIGVCFGIEMEKMRDLPTSRPKRSRKKNLDF
jgi:hypothetical protein